VGGTDVPRPPPGDARDMRRTYAVSWREQDGGLYAGKLELAPASLRLEGANNGHDPITRELWYEDLLGLHVGRSEADRLEGRPSLMLELREGHSVKIAGVAQPGIVSEIAEQLTALRLVERPHTTLVIVVPLKEGSRKEVEGLLAGGPPFDPESIGLERHRVYLTESEAIFSFEAEDEHAFERLLSETGLLASAAAWHDHIAGPPRLARLAVAWARPEDDDLSFAATPGPGDSDGGDLYSP
jgi:hypothetical protein